MVLSYSVRILRHSQIVLEVKGYRSVYPSADDAVAAAWLWRRVDSKLAAALRLAAAKVRLDATPPFDLTPEAVKRVG